MKIRGLVDEDFINYKIPSMFVAFPRCSFKCEKECGIQCCQNSKTALDPIIEINVIDLVDRYIKNPITHAIVCGGLEPFDTFDDLYSLVETLRKSVSDTVVIYTGYKEDEVSEYVRILRNFSNIVIKFGRFIPHQQPHYDEVLGVNLASKNQYAKKIS